MTHLRRLPALALLLLAACASPPPPAASAPIARIPRFAADDARVGTAGFVAQTLRLHHETATARYTLMAFVVGDTLTVGAMVRGPFRGQIRFVLAGHSLAFRFDTEAPPTEVEVVVDAGRAASLKGQGASFRGTMWINVDLPATTWLPPAARLSLLFDGADGTRILLPPDAPAYVVELIDS